MKPSDKTSAFSLTASQHDTLCTDLLKHESYVFALRKLNSFIMQLQTKITHYERIKDDMKAQLK